jgi:hypothetical protein
LHIKGLLKPRSEEQVRQASTIRYELTHTIFFPELPSLDWISCVRIVNPNGSQTQVQLIFRAADGHTEKTLETSIPHHGVKHFENSELRSGLNYGQVYSIEVHSAHTVHAERHQFDTTDKQYMVTPGTKPVKRQIVPYFRKEWMNWIIILNASNQENELEIEIRMTDPEPMTEKLKQLFRPYEHKILSLKAFESKSGYLIAQGTAPLLIESHYHHPSSGQQYSLIGQAM